MLYLHVSVLRHHRNMERESYYHQPFNLLPASPGSIVTAVIGGSLPFILLPSLLAPELLTKRGGRTGIPERSLEFLRHLLCARWTPQERLLLNLFAGPGLPAWQGK